jgi:hypothetical protein
MMISKIIFNIYIYIYILFLNKKIILKNNRFRILF